VRNIKITNPKQKILLIEYYLAHKADGIKSIAVDLGMSYTALSYHVNQYEKEKFLILPSKINKFVKHTAKKQRKK